MNKRVLSFLFVDVEANLPAGSSAPEGSPEPAEVVSQSLAIDGGRVFERVGTMLQSVFTSPLAAVEAAVALQRSVEAGAWRAHGLTGLRCAIHSGEAVERQSKFFGPTLTRLSNLVSVAHRGQILTSANTYMLVRDDDPAERVFRDLGFHHLKSMAIPEHIFQVVASGLPSDFPPPKTLTSYPTNLPTQLAPLIGRDAEVAAVRERLLGNGTGVTVLSGPPGVGKTHLSLCVGVELLEHFADGVFMVRFDGLVEPALTMVTIARTIGTVESPTRPLEEVLAEHLHDERRLVLLDNVSSPSPILAAIPELLNGGRSRLLITSREPLEIPGAAHMTLAPLAASTGKGAGAPDQQPYSPAARLFVTRAQTVEPTLPLGQQASGVVSRIVGALAGLPQAIEVVAAQVGTRTLEALDAELASRLGAFDSPDLERLLREALDWSAEQLSAEQLRLWRRLSVFAESCSVQQAQAVCGFDGEVEVDVLGDLGRLVDVGLVHKEERASAPRLSMPTSLHAYAHERLCASGELATLRARHFEQLLAWVEASERQSTGADPKIWLDQLEQNQTNLRAALRYALEAGRLDEALRLGSAIWKFWQLRGHLREGLYWMRQILERSTDLATPARSKALWGAGWLAYVWGDVRADLEEAERYFAEGVELSRRIGELRNSGLSLHGLGAIARFGGDYARAQALFEESLPIFRQVIDREHVAWTLQHLGFLALELGDYQRAQTFLKEGLSLFQLLGHRYGSAQILVFLGSTLREQGHYSVAQTFLDQALVIYKEAGDSGDIARTFLQIGSVALGLENYEDAVISYRESLLLHQQIHDKLGMVEALEGLAVALGKQGRLAVAIQLYGASDAIRSSYTGHVWSHVLHTFHQRAFSKLYDQSNKAAAAKAWELGQQMTLEQAVSYALKMAL